MRKTVLFLSVALVLSASIAIAQDYQRKSVSVPKVDPTAITIDANMDEAAWSTAAEANLVTATGFEMFTFPYYRPGLTEPEYNELYGRMLWAKDTLYVFFHCSIFVNDSTGLFWDGKWKGDQLFISLNGRFGVGMQGWYDGNVYAAPDGPYHFLVLGDKVTLNNGDSTGKPTEYMTWAGDTLKQSYDAAKICRSATKIDTLTGLWNVEMAIYNPNVNANSRLGFNIGGSTGSRKTAEQYGDAYAYFCWQPCVPDSPFVTPSGVIMPDWGADPGFYNLANADYWAVLTFAPGVDDYPRHQVTVPMVDEGSIKIDGKMDESAWGKAGEANLVTATGFQMFTYPYYRAGLTEPEYNELYGRMLWSKDTLYVFYHCSIFVNDSTGLFWNGKWTGDQLFISLSSRLGKNMMGWYDGNVYAAPGGPYHFLVLGDKVTLNNGDSTGHPDEFKAWEGDTVKHVYNAGDIARYATQIDTLTGLWNVEMAIYNPGVNTDARIGFNIGGSTGSRKTNEQYGDAYAYYCWVPSVIDSPFVTPSGVVMPDWGADPGFYNLATSDYWALLTMSSTKITSVDNREGGSLVPADFVLHQNYPNPFNPSTTISYALPREARVTLEIFNVLGQQVATLLDGRQEAGQHQVAWNARNVTSGVYFLQMKADEKSVGTRKLMLLK
jgi:hypothetical protein